MSAYGLSRQLAVLQNLVAMGHIGLGQAVRPADLWVHGLVTVDMLSSLSIDRLSRFVT
jgi:hypothetical protein